MPSVLGAKDSYKKKCIYMHIYIYGGLLWTLIAFKNPHNYNI